MNESNSTNQQIFNAYNLARVSRELPLVAAFSKIKCAKLNAQKKIGTAKAQFHVTLLAAH